MKLHIFNPDADMALADGKENYIAPASARLMARDLALLPLWYAGVGLRPIMRHSCNGCLTFAD